MFLGSSAGLAQDGKPTARLVVPYTAGGSADVLARAFAEGLAERQKRTVVVDNKPGAGTALGIAQVANSPDPNQIVFVSTGLVTNQFLVDKLPYKQDKLAPLVLVGAQPLVLFVHSSVPARTLQEFLAYAKSSAAPLTFGSAGQGSGNHLTTALLSTKSGVPYTHVPYKGVVGAVNDLTAGHIQALFAAYSSVGERPTVRAIAVAHTQRLKSDPSIPTFRENGVDLTSSSWYGFLASSDVSASVRSQLSADVIAVAGTRKVQDTMAKFGIEAHVTGPAGFTEFLRLESEKWGHIIRSQGIKAE